MTWSGVSPAAHAKAMTDNTELLEPNSPLSGAPTPPQPKPTDLKAAILNDNLAVLDDIGDLPPLPSRATRRIGKRNKISSRGGVLVQLPGWERPRVVYFESKLEQRVLFVLLARGDVIDLWEQPPLVRYFDDEGQPKHHFIDFYIVLESGRRIAIVVKPARIAARTKFMRELRNIRTAIRKDFADDLVLITDQDFTRDEALNAERYHDFSRHRCPATFDQLRALVSTTSFPTTVGDLARALDAGSGGFRTIFIAIYEGLLTADRTSKIDAETSILTGAAQ